MKATVALVAAGLALVACATKAPPYQPSIENVQALQRLGPGKVALGTVRVADGDAALNELHVRTLRIDSPNGDYGQYLREALLADLKTAGKYDASAPRALNATLVKNRLDSAGMDVAQAEVAAQFTVTEGAQVLYRKEQSATHQWESSFMGTLAAMRALHNYSVAVQKMLASLFADPQFNEALNR